MGPSLRFQILERDGFRCRYCGAAASEGAVLHVDHIHPRAHDGSDDPENLVTACRECNAGKSARLLGVTEQPVIFRGRTKTNKRRYRQHRVKEVEFEDWPEGSHCSTPLKVAAIAHQMGFTFYRDAWQYLSGLEAGNLPPHRMKDAAWLRLLKVNEQYALEICKGIVDPLDYAA